jgi:hypothetical protein
VKVADEFEEIGFLFDYDGAVAILDKVPAALVAPVERTRITRQQRPHRAGQRALGGPNEEVEMVRQERPGIEDPRLALDEVG